MDEHRWIAVETAAGDLSAEILRGLLEAQGIPVLLSQEGAARAMGVSVGPFGEVEILVPEHMLEQAQRVLEDYEAGNFETNEDLSGEETPQDGGETSDSAS